MTTVEKKMKPRCKLIGIDGNVFNIIAAVRRSLRKAGDEPASKEFTARATSSESYDAVLALCDEYVEIY